MYQQKDLLLSKELIQAIDNVDDCLSCLDLAKSIAFIMNEYYSSANREKFLETLKQELDK